MCDKISVISLTAEDVAQIQQLRYVSQKLHHVGQFACSLHYTTDYSGARSWIDYNYHFEGISQVERHKRAKRKPKPVEELAGVPFAVRFGPLSLSALLLMLT
jgi:hypothetical protein